MGHPVKIARTATNYVMVMLVLLGTLSPSVSFADRDADSVDDTDAESFGEPDDTCQYTGGLGGPFPGVPPCSEGRTTEMPTCANCTNSWFPERDEKIVCEDSSDCVELVGKYMACGGPITPFVVDDDDNIYFWAGRWNLHSLDSRGNLRWRFNFCNPPEDSLCMSDPDECRPSVARMVPMVMDYHGTLYFFIGNVFYAINSDGELLLKHRVEIPGTDPVPRSYLKIAGGPQDTGANLWANGTGAPVLHEDGHLTVAFHTVVPEVTDEVMPAGVLEISRTGEVLNTGDFMWESETPEFLSMQRLTATSDGQLGLAGRVGYGLGKATFFALSDLEPVWRTELPKDFGMESIWDYDEIRPDLAVGPEDRIYGGSRFGAIYGFDVGEQVKKRLFNFHSEEGFSWQNRPIISADGTMYVSYRHQPLGPSLLWALDTTELWNNPVPERSEPGLPADPDDYPGVLWRRIYSGAGGWSTPVLARNGRLYDAMGGIGALDPETGKEIWRFGERTMASAPTILSDGTIVVGQGITGRVFFLKEDTPNGSMADEGWPTAMHDRYLSNNAAHPFRWDRSGEPPYPSVDELLEDVPPCWNEADWDTEQCGPLPDPSDRHQDAGAPEAGDTNPSADADEDVDGDREGSDADGDGESHGADAARPSDASQEPASNSQSRNTGSCAGCSTCASATGYDSPGVLLALSIGIILIGRVRRRHE